MMTQHLASADLSFHGRVGIQQLLCLEFELGLPPTTLEFANSIICQADEFGFQVRTAPRIQACVLSLTRATSEVSIVRCAKVSKN